MSARSVPSSQRTTASRKLAIMMPTPMVAETAIISAAMATPVRESAAMIAARGHAAEEAARPRDGHVDERAGGRRRGAG